jgi:hypothetical protein
MTLQHKVFGEVEPLEANYYVGQKVLITQCGNGTARNIFVGDSRWASVAKAEEVWETLRKGS